VLGDGEFGDELDQTLAVAQPDDLERYEIVVGKVQQLGARHLVLHEVTPVLAHAEAVEPITHLLGRPRLGLCTVASANEQTPLPNDRHGAGGWEGTSAVPFDRQPSLSSPLPS